MQLLEIDKKILSYLQESIPIKPRPFLELANLINSDEKEIISRINALKEQKIIREISPILEANRLGYQSTLVALEIEKNNLEEVANEISKHPGVSHNYERDNKFNLWFTLTLPCESSFEKTIGYFKNLTAVKNSLFLPTLKLFKIGVKFDLGNSITQKEEHIEKKQEIKNYYEITDKIKKIICAIQQDLPCEKEPWNNIAKKVPLEREELLKNILELINNKIIRRYAAILKHTNIGYNINAMVVWKSEEKNIENIGEIFGSFKEVTHCYQRPTYPNWPYPLFTMIHAKSKEELDSVINQMQEKSNIKNFEALNTKREFKKTRVKYFDGKTEEWERKNLCKNF
jgi:DNA-binding Lrp family transcriptional regulator